MRVIAGTLRGRPLRTPAGTATRPTADRVRESLFNLIGPMPDGVRVLDLYAGSGALGIEALSRGAMEADFVEANRKAAMVIEENLTHARLQAKARVHAVDVFKLLGGWKDRVDLVFADPPYAANSAEDLAGRLLADSSLPKVLGPNGLLVVEVETERDPPPGKAGWIMQDRRAYGGSAILFYGWEEAA